MPDDIDTLIRGLIGGDDTASTEILDRAATDDPPTLLAAAALLAEHPDNLLVGGLITGAVLGAVQAWGLNRNTATTAKESSAS